EIASPNLQIIFDPVNLLDEQNCRDHKAVIKNAIDVLGPDIAIVHVKDFDLKDGKLVSMAAGLGVMDYSDIVDFIVREKPYIQCTLEDTKPDNAVAARLFFEGGAKR
ncbi:MAG: sugar phosphate isomerase/epimerase, partial [Lachnospiraceae bacterium]|nr:sugar phosphate isomerase/epimerase [Lachnospiraceae bacterium]